MHALSRLVLAEGFDGLTVAVLADRLHCSRRTLYTLAPSREELVLGVVHDLFDDWMKRACAAAAAADDDVAAVVAFLAAGLDIGDASATFFADVGAHPDTAVVHEGFKVGYMAELVQLLGAVHQDPRRPPVGDVTTAEVLAAVIRRLAHLTHGQHPTLTILEATGLIDDLVRSWLRPDADVLD